MWQLKSEQYKTENQALDESLFMIGNGYLGIRGCFEEGYPAGETVRGSYINGLYDRVPMVHAEMAYGFPTEQDKQPRIMDTQTVLIMLDGQRMLLNQGQYKDYERLLDYQTGEAIRRFTFIAESGKIAHIEFKRMASFTRKSLMVYRISVVYDGEIELISILDTDIENYSNPDDPRTGQGHTRLMRLKQLNTTETRTCALMETTNSQIEQAVCVAHVLNAKQPVTVNTEIEDSKAYTMIRTSQQVVLEKRCVFTDGLRHKNPLIEAIAYQDSIKDITFETFQHEQRAFLDAFWYHSGIEILGAPEDQGAIRMMQFHLLQSVGSDEHANVAAKGLSGEGYEGHYFWDTEIYVLPILMMTQPERAKSLLAFRHRILPYAKARAIELGHEKGAAYAWRTISGIECSGYFPAGTAQYHINADIAYAFVQYYLYTNDLHFIAEKGAEVIFETARLWLEMGHFHKGQFHIHNVTGPDEYTAIVNNNYYTNAMAKYHLYWAYKIYHLLEKSSDETIKILANQLFDKIGLKEEEIMAMKRASDHMYFCYNPEHGLYAQDDAFLSKPIWPFSKSEGKKPLLLYYHPLTIYRHQVLKQADTVLAHMLLEQYASEEEIKNAYLYYEKLTTHDSSLSSCIYGIMAARIGDLDKATRYFRESVNLDLHDTHGNTKDGLHIANIAGTLLSVTWGFAGLRIFETGLSLRPVKPEAWKQLTFKIGYQGRVIEISVGDKVKATLLEGDAIDIEIWGKSMKLRKKKSSVEGIIFDMDGVLTETSKAHFEAWRWLASDLGFDVPEHLEDEVRGISRLDSLEKVLKYANQPTQYTSEEKTVLADRKNAKYLELIKAYSPENLSYGAVELLEMLKQKGIKIGLASASNNAPFLLKAMGIEHYFDAVVDPRSVAKGKPAPDIFLKASELLNLPPDTCIGIEDAYAGIESIHAAGMNAIGIGAKEHLTNCDVVLSGLDSLRTHLQNHLL